MGKEMGDDAGEKKGSRRVTVAVEEKRRSALLRVRARDGVYGLSARNIKSRSRAHEYSRRILYDS